MSRYAVGDRVSVVILFNPRQTGTGVVVRLPSPTSPCYVVDVDGEEMLFPAGEILGVMPPADPSPAGMLEWLRS
jgi:protein involved in polysaccharide export with SLBB domain